MVKLVFPLSLMHIKIHSPVQQAASQVIAGFNRDLFLQLNPPFPPVKLLRFDGSKQGDQVILELNFIFFRQTWESLITEDGENEEEIYFVDEGIKLPFFLKSWRHRHRILKKNTKAEIVDDIEYRTPFWLMDYLMYPVLYLQFWYRKPIYQRIFRK